MSLDRERILQTAQKFVDKKKYDRAIAEYQKIVQQDPNDARTLLKIGDLQARMDAYAEAIATYDRVGQFYAAQGFALKAIAVYKQIRELIKKHVPQLADRYGHIVPKLAEIYTQLGLTSDALAAYDEVATRLQRNGRDRDAIQVFQKMVSLDSTNPLPHLRLAEACCRVQAVDEAIDSFWTAAELLIHLKRRDDALKVVERILHFRQDTQYAQVAAELYLERGEQQDGLQALAKLQLCFQHDPKDLRTLELLARAFVLIKQAEKAVEVKKEMARLARDLGRRDIFQETLAYLLRVAPLDEQVQALARGTPSVGPDSPISAISVDDVDVVESQMPAPRKPRVDPDDIDFDDEPVARRGAPSTLDVDVEEIEPPQRRRPSSTVDVEVEDLDIQEIAARPTGLGGRTYVPSAPDLVVVDGDLEAAEHFDDEDEASEARAHARKAVVDAESFRGLRLYSKAIETLRIALEIDPRSFEIREKLRDILAEAGDRAGSIEEMLNLAAIYADENDYEKAESELYRILEIEPEHPGAYEMLEQLGAITAQETAQGYYGEQPYTEEAYTTTADFTVRRRAESYDNYDPEAPLPSYDLEEVSASAAIVPPEAQTSLAEVDDPFGAVPRSDVPLPSFPLRSEDAAAARSLRQKHDGGDLDFAHPAIPRAAPVPADDLAASSHEAIEEALDEAEFFASRGLYDDARMILTDQLARTPNHPLVLERLQELDAAVRENGESGARDRAELEPEDEAPLSGDQVFDIAASLDALDELEEATRSSRHPSALESGEEVDVDELFAKFKEGVRQQVSESDSATHYDLGVAYKEMGLLGDAIGEFELAARDAKIECTCFAMVGMIHLEQGDLDHAAEAYIAGLAATQKTIDQEMSLYYDLGTVYEMKGSAQEALYYFKKISRRDPGYRDVLERIEALQGAPPRAARGRPVSDEDEFDTAFEELFESK